MANREQRGPSGTIELYYDWWESGSGHREITKEATLEIDKKGRVVLVVSNTDANFIKGGTDDSRGKWVIGVEELMQLIKEHGQQVSSR